MWGWAAAVREARKRAAALLTRLLSPSPFALAFDVRTTSQTTKQHVAEAAAAALTTLTNRDDTHTHTPSTRGDDE